MKVAFHTLGCKVNQYDSEAMLECFARAGYEVVPFQEKADVYGVNTCTVTGTGDAKSLLRCGRRLRELPEAKRTGCVGLALREAARVLVPGVGLVIGVQYRAQVVVNSGGSHDNLTAFYAAIPQEMRAVAACFGETSQRRVQPGHIMQMEPKMRGRL